MTASLRTSAFLAIFFLPSAFVRANEAPPRPDPKPAAEKAAPLTIEIDDKAKEPKLVIPRKLLGAWGAPGKQERSELNLSPLHTAVVGIALTGALVFGGLWLVRSRGRFGGRGLALLVGSLVLLGAGAAAVWAEPVPIPQPKPAPAISFDKTSIEIVEQGDAVKLIVNREHLAKMSETATPKK
jgi:hypothetical protein